MQRILVFMLRIFPDNCKIYDSQADWLITNNYGQIEFVRLIFRLVAGVKFT